MRYNLIMGIVWLCIGVALIVGHYAGFQRLGMDRELTPLLGFLAMVLAAWNMVRWWASHSAAKAPPPRKRSVEERPSEYNPAFDFTRPEPPQK